MSGSTNSLNLSRILALRAEKAAPLLLGWTISRNTTTGTIKLKIVETEAYHQTDPASHSFRGLTKRTAPMFEAGGHLYVYFTYGAHYCLNIVTGQEGIGEGVLIRAGEPIAGLSIMKLNRGVEDTHKLANGPGKLAQSLGINSNELSGKILDKSSIWLEPPKEQINPKNIIASPRIGIKQAVDVPWRFYLRDSLFVSKNR